MPQSLELILDEIVKSLPFVNPNKHYWLIRTNGGEFYNDFFENNYVAIDPANIRLSVFKDIEKRAAGNPDQLSKILKNHIKDTYATVTGKALSNRSAGLDAGQIIRFAHEVKKGDIVIIPSHNSDYVSIGEITESYLAEFTDNEIKKTICPYELRRRVKWLKTTERAKLDINLYLVFTAHQMINQIDGYKNIIERTVNGFYILYENAHLILNVEKPGMIPAKDLFAFGNLLMDTLDEYATYANLSISSGDFELEININSPGKLDLKSGIKKTTYVLGIIMFLCGGGYEDKAGNKLKTDGVQALIKSISEFLDKRQDRELKEKAFNKYIDSLHIKNPEEFNKLMKQFSDNKDSPK